MPKLKVVYPTTRANNKEKVKQNNKSELPNTEIKNPINLDFQNTNNVISSVNKASSDAKNIITFFASHTKGLKRDVPITAGLFATILSSVGLSPERLKPALLPISSIS